MNRTLATALPATKLALTAALLALAACSAKAPEKTETAAGTPVRVTPATSGPGSAPIGASGLVANEDEMRLSFKTGGILRRIAVREGTAVRKGQVLAELELTEINAQYEQARQAALKAQRDLERGERLNADQVISVEALQNLRTQAAVARAASAAARFNLGYSSIVAPQDGRVLRRLVEERELVPPGQPVLLFGGSGGGQVVHAALADREVVQVAVGDTAQVRLDAYPGRVFEASVREIAAAADPRSGLFPVQVRMLPQVGATPASGMVARVEISPSSARRDRLTRVPIAALVEGRGDAAVVFVVDQGVARKRAVRVAFIAGAEVALASGLAVGEPVVSEGALYLEDGDKVRVLPTATPAAAVPAATPAWAQRG